MLSCEYFYRYFAAKGVDFFAGVPDSLLQDFCAYLQDNVGTNTHIVASNEGAAVALACGHYLASSRPGLVYMQNSGEGNAMNPLVSLADPEVYNIPLILVIGWRGEPKKHDEPQHAKQGKITLGFLDLLDIPYRILPDQELAAEKCLDWLFKTLKGRKAPVALVVRKDTFIAYKTQIKARLESGLTREKAIELFARELKSRDVVVSTTGKASRELYQIRQRLGQGHDQDFLTVGSMGHSSQIALGVALAQPSKQVFCLDGDGAIIMHMGSLAIIGSQKARNFKHIILNNGAHESVGGLATAGFSVSFKDIARACGYLFCLEAGNEAQFRRQLKILRDVRGPALLEIRLSCGSRADLGRPKEKPAENKAKFMEFLADQGPETYAGPGSILRLKDILKNISSQRILLVIGEGSYKKSGAEKKLSRLLKNYSVFVFSDFEKNPRIEDLLRGTRAARKFKYDSVIAVGGGSVIDMAKMINFFAQNRFDPAEYIKNGSGVDGKAKPLIAVPTTNGSGSEATHFSVLYSGKKKFSVSHECIRPDYAVLDPLLTLSLPGKVAAASGMDALSQAIESYWSVNSNQRSKDYARRAIELARDNLIPAVKRPALGPRSAMLEAAHLAGRAINITKTSACHALSYPLTAYFNIPHGHAVALTLPAVLEYNYKVSSRDILDKRGAGYVRKTMKEIFEMLGARSLEGARDRIKYLMAEIGLQSRLSQVGVSSIKDIDKLVDQGVDQSRAKNNPRSFTAQTLKMILRSIY